MARKRPERKNAKTYQCKYWNLTNPETTQDIQAALKDLTADLIEEMLWLN